MNTILCIDVIDGTPWFSFDSGLNFNASFNSLSFTPPQFGIASNSTIFCIVSSNTNDCAITSDGDTFIYGTLPSSGYIQVVYNGTVFCALKEVGSEVAISRDGLNWTAHILSQTATHWNSIVWNGSALCIFGGDASNTLISTSPEGINWTNRDTTPLNQTGNYSFSISRSGELLAFYLTGEGTNVARSSDNGITWLVDSVAIGGSFTFSATNGNAISLILSQLSNLVNFSNNTITLHRGGGGVYSRTIEVDAVSSERMYGNLVDSEGNFILLTDVAVRTSTDGGSTFSIINNINNPVASNINHKVACCINTQFFLPFWKDYNSSFEVV